TGIAASQGTPQSATVNTTFATTLQVLVTRPGTSDVINPPPQPIEGAQVTFSAPGSGPSGTFLTSNVVFTDTAGHASVTFRANGQAGAYLVTATVAGVGLS